jgi:Protein of unknown function (DUF2786)
MSSRNREKRAAKQKARKRAQRVPSGNGPSPEPESPFAAGPDRAQRQEMLVDGLMRSAVCTCDEGPDGHAAALLDDIGSLGRELDTAADLAVSRTIRRSWEAGWMPLDLVELARRRLPSPVGAYLAEAVVVESRRYAPAMVHPRWRAAVETVSGTVDAAVRAETGSAHLRLWADRTATVRRQAVATVLQVLNLLAVLPVLERLLPLPGQSRYRVAARDAGEVDPKVLGRIRGLLAKAESTEFPDEAEALSAKAQELMSRYSLHQAVLDHDSGRDPAVAGRRLWIDAPYADAKALLVQAVATANRARTVWSSHLGFATVIGADVDLDGVELLVTSLLVQANRAMLAEGRQTTRNGTSRTRSFRQSFVVSYATRIGERLDSATSCATAEIDAEMQQAAPAADSRLLPVLAARADATDEMTERLFPTMVQRGVSASNTAGWVAGRAAADLAQFDVRGAVAR